MDQTIELLQKTALFAGMDEAGLARLLACFAPQRRSCGRGELLLQCGQESRFLGIVLQGQIEAVRPLPGGGQVPISRMGPGGVFGDVLGGTGLKSPVTVRAAVPCEVLLLPYAALLTPCPENCAAHTLLLRNLVGSLGRKYFALFDRIELLTLRTLRAKVCAYLLAEAGRAGADTFTVPYTRAGMAEYLGCERSALSRELSRMQREGLIETSKSSFKLLDKPALERLYQA